MKSTPSLRLLSGLLCAAILSSILGSCSKDKEGCIPATSNDACSPLVITASVNNFGNAPGTRANDEGLNTTFGYTDRLGLTILDQQGNVLCDNVPYVYNYDGWVFDTQNADGKTAPYYDSKAYTYIAYFPYSKKADGITTVEGLKQQFKPYADQRRGDAYRASDLLVWSNTGSALKTVNIAFEHAYALLRFTPKAVLTTDAGDITLSVNSDEVNFTIGGTTWKPYKERVSPNSNILTGNYRLIVPAGTPFSFRWFFNFGEAVGSGTTNELNLTANHIYAYTATAPVGSYKIADNGAVGDYYCKSANNSTAYLIPGYAPMYTAEEKASCIGIVCKVGNPATDDALLGTNHSGCTHGWVLALNGIQDDGAPVEYGTMKWSDPSEDINAWAKTGFPKYSDGTIRAQDKRCGYSNTQVLLAYNEALSSEKTAYQVVPVEAIEKYGTNHCVAPASSSGWFFPSLQEVRDICDQRGFLSGQVSKAGGNSTSFGSYSWWSSSEDSESKAWNMNFKFGSSDNYRKSNNYCPVRAVLAF